MSTPRDGHRERRTAAVILVGVLSLLAAPSQAAANSYHDFLCRIPYGPTIYTFRVALPDTGAQGYPYTPAASNQVEVRVAP